MSSSLELWIGLVELKPFDPKVYGAAGAFTHIVTWARDFSGFERNVETIAAKLSMFVAGVERVRPLPKEESLSEELEDMVFRAESNPNAIIYGTFHQYPYNEA